jgi:YegS/Rv2252/BmrU family lipid kinase
MLEYFFIVNPVSGRGSGKRFPDQLARHPLFAATGYALHFTERPGHAAELAARASREGYACVVAVGGDGTVNEVGGALRDTGTRMGIIPRGSGNGFARHLGISSRPAKALEQLARGLAVQVDVMDINGHCSLNVSGLGFDAAVAHLFAGGKRRGLLAYAWTVLRLWLRHEDQLFTFRTNGREWQERCLIVSLANSSQYGNNIAIAPAASARDGLLDLCTMRRPRPLALPYYLFCIATRRAGRLSRFREIACEEVTIDIPRPEAHVDGEPCTFTSPVRARICAGALRVVAGRADV